MEHSIVASTCQQWSPIPSQPQGHLETSPRPKLWAIVTTKLRIQLSTGTSYSAHLTSRQNVKSAGIKTTFTQMAVSAGKLYRVRIRKSVLLNCCRCSWNKVAISGGFLAVSAGVECREAPDTANGRTIPPALPGNSSRLPGVIRGYPTPNGAMPVEKRQHWAQHAKLTGK